jgi:hypothetical protein
MRPQTSAAAMFPSGPRLRLPTRDRAPTAAVTPAPPGTRPAPPSACCIASARSALSGAVPSTARSASRHAAGGRSTSTPDTVPSSPGRSAHPLRRRAIRPAGANLRSDPFSGARITPRATLHPYCNEGVLECAARRTSTEAARRAAHEPWWPLRRNRSGRWGRAPARVRRHEVADQDASVTLDAIRGSAHSLGFAVSVDRHRTVVHTRSRSPSGKAKRRFARGMLRDP